MTPVLIRFHLSTPLCSPDHPLHLDSLLAWAEVDRAGGDLAAMDNLPLARHTGADGRWVWCASHVVYQVLWRNPIPYTRAFEPWQWGEDKDCVFAKGPNVVTQGSGPCKGYQLMARGLQVPVAVAWAVGDPEGIADLLGRVRNLGKLARLDMGRVGRVEVVPDEHAAEWWRLRAMPAELPGYARSVETLRPPYFRRDLREDVWVPDAELARRALASASVARPGQEALAGI
jgi:hypothetical protein